MTTAFLNKVSNLVIWQVFGDESTWSGREVIRKYFGLFRTSCPKSGFKSMTMNKRHASLLLDGQRKIRFTLRARC